MDNNNTFTHYCLPVCLHCNFEYRKKWHVCNQFKFRNSSNHWWIKKKQMNFWTQICQWCDSKGYIPAYHTSVAWWVSWSWDKALGSDCVGCLQLGVGRVCWGPLYSVPVCDNHLHSGASSWLSLVNHITFSNVSTTQINTMAIFKHISFSICMLCAF